MKLRALFAPRPGPQPIGLWFGLVVVAPLAAAQAPPAAPRTPTQADEYTKYELLAPETAQFRIYYDVTATSPGASYFFNPIRKGSEASNEAVYDKLNGKPLKFEEVTGAEARASGMSRADLDTSYIRVSLPRPVPKDGQVRLLIDKTYKDPKSYYREGDLIVFSRPLGIKRNSVVLPAGYELVSCSVPAQVLQQPDGRIAVSFMNAWPDQASVVVKGRKLTR
jgi:hypothetical protein